VERLAEKVGIKEPPLSKTQLKSFRIKSASTAGRVFGVVAGCILGMFPLMFRDSDESRSKEKEKEPEEPKKVTV